jgi:hypothetical protein
MLNFRALNERACHRFSTIIKKIKICEKDSKHKKSSGVNYIEDTPTPKNSRDSMIDIVVALRELYKDVNYRNQILTIPDKKVNAGKSSTGRPGMDLWEIFVPAQIRLAKRLSYVELHTQANYNKPVRQVMGIEAKRKIGIGRSRARCVFDEEYLSGNFQKIGLFGQTLITVPEISDTITYNVSGLLSENIYQFKTFAVNSVNDTVYGKSETFITSKIVNILPPIKIAENISVSIYPKAFIL